MMHWVTLALCFWNFSEVAAKRRFCTRIVGGSMTSIETYPSTAVVLLNTYFGEKQICGGTIVNQRHILTAAHCFMLPGDIIPIDRYLIRVGSTMAHSGGAIHGVEQVTIHPKWNRTTINNDVAIMRTANAITYGTAVQPARLAESTYRLLDNDSVWAVGWGLTEENGVASEQLRHVNVFVISNEICKDRFKNHIAITENMLCTGWLDIGGYDQCIRDSGTPVYHHKTVVGYSSLGVGCARACYPGVNVRVSRFVNWIKKMTRIKKSALKTKPKQASTVRIAFDIDFDALKKKFG